MRVKLAFIAALCAFLPHAVPAATPADGSVLPFPPVPSASVAKPRLQDSVHRRRAQPQHLKPGAPNVLIILLDDVGFGQASTFGGEMNTPTLSKLASQGVSYNTFHTTADLLADARGTADRAQPPARRQRHDRRAGGRLGRLHRRDPEDLRHDGGGAASLRLQDGRIRQVAQHAGRPDHRDGPVRSLADRPRFRLLLRLPRRRDLAVGTPAGREHERGGAAARREVPPERRHRAARRRLAAQTSRVLARQAVLHVLGAGCGARAAPGLQGLVRQVQGQVRRRLGRLPRARVRTPEAARLDPGRHQAHAARRIDAVVGQHSRSAAPVPAAPDGDLRRLRRARGCPGRQADRRTRAPRHPRQHHRHLHLRRQRRQRRRPERHDQRAAGAERHPEHRRAAAGGAGQDRRPGRARHAQDRQHVSRRLGVGRQHAVPPHEAGGVAFRRHAQPDGHLVAEGHQAGPHAAATVSPRQRHRADHLRDRRHQAAEGGRRIRAGPDRRREPRLHLRRCEGAHTQEGAVLRQQRQPRHLPGRLGGGHVRPAGAVAARRTRPRRLGFGEGQVGAVPDHQGFLAGRRSRREGTEAPGAAAEDVRPAGQGEQGLSARRRHLAAPAPRGSHQDALHELAVRRDHHAHARVHRAGTRPREQHGDHRRGNRRERLRRAVRAGRIGRRPHALHGQGRSWSTSTT